MKTRNFAKVALVLAVTMTISCLSAMAAPQQTSTIPVTLTVIHTAHSIDVTLPVCIPVSVADNEVLVAENMKIINNAQADGVEVSGIRVEDAACTISDYNNFPKNQDKIIALCINGCATEKAGPLSISKDAFPIIQPGQALPLIYSAKVGHLKDASEIEAARVVFTLRRPVDTSPDAH